MSNLMKTVALVAAVTTVINIVLAFVGRAVSMPPDTFGPYMVSSIAFLNILGVVAAAVVYWAMRRFIADPAKADKRFLILSVVVLVVSFYPDVMLPYSTEADDVGWTYGIIANLILMHVVTGAAVMKYFPQAMRVAQQTA